MNRFVALLAVGGLMLLSCGGDDSSDDGSASPVATLEEVDVNGEEVDEAMLELIRQSGRRIGGAALSCSPGHREQVAAAIKEYPEALSYSGRYEAEWWGLDDASLGKKDLEKPSDYSDETWAAVLFFIDNPAAFDHERFIDLYLEYELSRCD